MKTTSALIGCNDPGVLPRDSVKSDWEVELGVVIGRRARYVSEADALAHVAGYCVVNDLSEREYQLERGGTWDKGKGCDTFGPVGPWWEIGSASCRERVCQCVWIQGVAGSFKKKKNRARKKQKQKN